MIVTCPGCASKYRVRNEAVPPDGARMRCPKCETLFLAKPPAAGESNDDAPPAGPFSSPQFAPPPTGIAQISMPPQQGFGGQGFASPQAAPFSQPPFSQPPGPFSAGSSSSSVPQFGGAQSLPPQFGAPSSSGPTFGTGAGNGSGFVPQAPNTAGPLTAMMRQLDPSSLPPGSLPSAPPMPTSLPPHLSMSSSQSLPTLSQAPHAAPPDDDPFARINVDPRQDPGLPAPTTERLRPDARAPTRSGAIAPPPVPATQVPVRPRQELPPSMAMIVGSWIAVVVGGLGAVMGVVFAAWTSEAVDFDASLMPFAERSLGATPPYSFVGRDDVDASELRHQAEAKETAGDLPAAAVLWRRVLDRDPADVAAKAGLPRVLTALGDKLH
jgi:predicted Zn finger-like uncharacterized protein